MLHVTGRIGEFVKRVGRRLWCICIHVQWFKVALMHEPRTRWFIAPFSSGCLVKPNWQNMDHDVSVWFWGGAFGKRKKSGTHKTKQTSSRSFRLGGWKLRLQLSLVEVLLWESCAYLPEKSVLKFARFGVFVNVSLWFHWGTDEIVIVTRSWWCHIVQQDIILWNAQSEAPAKTTQSGTLRY